MGLLSGLKGPAPPAQLAPFNPPIGVLPLFCQPQPVTLVLKERGLSFSGDDFSVKDANGTTVVKVSGKAWGIGDKKDVLDVNGKKLFRLKKKLISLHATYVATDADTDAELFVCKKKFAMMGSKAVVTFKNLAAAGAVGAHAGAPGAAGAAVGAEIELVMRGDFLGGRAEIVLGERPVATISRQIAAKEFFGSNSQTYFVAVAAGVDLAMMAAVCVVFDELEHDEKK